MSWDVNIIQHEVCPTCKRGRDWFDVRNVTYNNSRIFHTLGVHPEVTDGMKCAIAIPILEKALEESHKKEPELKTMEPSNGWGGLQDSRDFISTLLEKCREFPDGTISWN